MLAPLRLPCRLLVARLRSQLLQPPCWRQVGALVHARPTLRAVSGDQKGFATRTPIGRSRGLPMLYGGPLRALRFNRASQMARKRSKPFAIGGFSSVFLASV